MWGTVCRDNFQAGEATVFCRMLGYDGEASWGEVEKVRQREGSWPIWIALVEEGKCQGDEESIEECHEPGLWRHSGDICRHREDVVLTCHDTDTQFSPRPQRAVKDLSSLQVTVKFTSC